MKICRFSLPACLLLGFCLTLGCLEPLGAAPPEMSGSIKEMMSPAEFNAAGLNKLSADELQKLDAWLQGYRATTEQAAEKKDRAAFRSELVLRTFRESGIATLKRRGLPAATEYGSFELEFGSTVLLYVAYQTCDEFRGEVEHLPAA